jgi:hypothetical protein
VDALFKLDTLTATSAFVLTIPCIDPAELSAAFLATRGILRRSFRNIFGIWANGFAALLQPIIHQLTLLLWRSINKLVQMIQKRGALGFAEQTKAQQSGRNFRVVVIVQSARLYGRMPDRIRHLSPQG